jgi:hypothetical protein
LATLAIEIEGFFAIGGSFAQRKTLSDFRKEPTPNGHGGRMLEETPTIYTLLTRNDMCEPALSCIANRADGRPEATYYQTKSVGGVAVAQSTESEKEKLVESIRAFLTEMSLRAAHPRCCLQCGAVMQHLDVTIWLYGTDSGWNLRLPICPCRIESNPDDLTTQRGVSMNTGVALSPLKRNWRELYTAAVFEPDRNKLSERIALAEWALAVRARELFHTDSEHFQERQAVDAAIAALQALRATTCNEGRRGVHRVQAA